MAAAWGQGLIAALICAQYHDTRLTYPECQLKGALACVSASTLNTMQIFVEALVSGAPRQLMVENDQVGQSSCCKGGR